MLNKSLRETKSIDHLVLNLHILKSTRKKLPKLLISWISWEQTLILKISSMSSWLKSNLLCLARTREIWLLSLKGKTTFLNSSTSQSPMRKKNTIRARVNYHTVLPQICQMLKFKWSNSLIKSFNLQFPDMLSHQMSKLRIWSLDQIPHLSKDHLAVSIIKRTLISSLMLDKLRNLKKLAAWRKRNLPNQFKSLLIHSLRKNLSYPKIRGRTSLRWK